jgi:hypothetical protein
MESYFKEIEQKYDAINQKKRTLLRDSCGLNQLPIGITFKQMPF